MGVEVKVLGKEVDQILDIVRELRAFGYTQEVDFNFSWEPARYDWLGSAEEPSCTTFTFYNDQAVTFFKLKYQ